MLIFEAVSFAFFAVLHLGLDVSLGFIALDEPRRNYAVIVESAAAAALASAAVATITRRAWARRAATAAQAVSLLGVLWGQVAIRAGRGPHTTLNDTFHVVMTAILIAGVGLSVSWRRQPGPKRLPRSR